MTLRFTTFARNIATLALICLAITMKADTATNKTLFDFQAATNSSPWEVVNDDVMGGVSTSQFQVLTNGCAVFRFIRKVCSWQAKVIGIAEKTPARYGLRWQAQRDAALASRGARFRNQ